MPSGIGTLNIITRKQYAAAMASRAMCRLFTTRRTRLLATAHAGTIDAPRTPHEEGLR